MQNVGDMGMENFIILAVNDTGHSPELPQSPSQPLSVSQTDDNEEVEHSNSSILSLYDYNIKC